MNKNGKAAEPSMDEILASIRKIIAEEPPPPRPAPGTARRPEPFSADRMPRPGSEPTAPAPPPAAKSPPKATRPTIEIDDDLDDLVDRLPTASVARQPMPPKAEPKAAEKPANGDARSSGPIQTGADTTPEPRKPATPAAGFGSEDLRLSPRLETEARDRSPQDLGAFVPRREGAMPSGKSGVPNSPSRPDVNLVSTVGRATDTNEARPANRAPENATRQDADGADDDLGLPPSASAPLETLTASLAGRSMPTTAEPASRAVDTAKPAPKPVTLASTTDDAREAPVARRSAPATEAPEKAPTEEPKSAVVQAASAASEPAATPPAPQKLNPQPSAASASAPAPAPMVRPAVAAGARPAATAASAQPAAATPPEQPTPAPTPPQKAETPEAAPTAGPLPVVGSAPQTPPPAAVVPSPPATAMAGLMPAASRSLEDTVAELLRPMLRQWLDANMPRIVEKALRIELADKMAKPVQKPPATN